MRADADSGERRRSVGDGVAAACCSLRASGAADGIEASRTLESSHLTQKSIWRLALQYLWGGGDRFNKVALCWKRVAPSGRIAGSGKSSRCKSYSWSSLAWLGLEQGQGYRGLGL